jgi:cytochrome c peroxidase
MRASTTLSQPVRLLLRAGCGMGAVLLTGAALLVSSVSGCGGGGTRLVNASAASAEWDWYADAGLPANFPIPAVPADNPMSRAKVALGRYLFYDKQLSGNGTFACASCHFQDRAFTDGRAVALGSTGESHPRNAQGLANVAFNATLTWANPLLLTLEQQMETPLFGSHPVEMGLNTANQPTVLARFSKDVAGVGYPAMFAAAFPEVPEAERVSLGNIIKAISAFERTMFAGNSRYDRRL